MLFWGVLGATLIEDFHWIIYLFGAFLVFTAIRMALQKNEGVNPEKNPLLKFVRRVLPVTEHCVENRFVVRQAGKLMVTPLLLVLIVKEGSETAHKQ